MADVMRMPDNSFGTVPTPAIVAPIEFSMRLADYRALGGHMELRALARRGAARRAPGTTTARRPARRWSRQRGGQSAGRSGQPPLLGLTRRWPAQRATRCPTAAGTSSTAPSTSSSAPTATPMRCAMRTSTHGSASRPCSTSWWPSCRCCASRWRARHARCTAASRAACGRPAQPFRAGFITPMAAVAGAVAQELIASYAARRRRPRLGQQRRRHRAAPGARRSAVRVGLFADLARLDARAVLDGMLPTDGRFERRTRAAGARRGHQRLARAQLLARHRRQRHGAGRTAAAADAAATVIANAVDVDDARIVRRPASELKDDSDLGDIPVTVDVPRAGRPEVVRRALDCGARRARELHARAALIWSCCAGLPGPCWRQPTGEHPVPLQRRAPEPRHRRVLA